MSHYHKWKDALEDIVVGVRDGTIHTSVVSEAIKRDKQLSDNEKTCLIDYFLRKL